MKNNSEKCPVCGEPFKYHIFSGKAEKQCDHKFRVRPKAWAIILLLFLITLMQAIVDSSTTSQNVAANAGERFGEMIGVVIMALIIYFIVIKIVGFDRAFKVINNEKTTK